ncbi:MAG: tetratricopeptide repeat protein [Deltaproteobacteria bacterium]|nr:MAG: tetratricopeptide repeat protein [Deltaproteobacteria bacterium]
MDPAELESRRAAAEREVRRGNFRAALSAYDALIAANPGNEALLARRRSLEAFLQPMELHHPKAASAGEGEPEGASEVHLGEAAANAGDYAAAAAHYERALAADPGNALLAERLEELRRLAATAPPGGAPAPAAPGTAPALRAPTKTAPTGGNRDAGPVATRGAQGSLGTAAPVDPIARLQVLLERVQARRRRLAP